MRVESSDAAPSTAERHRNLLHVFALSSPITELAAQGAIEHEGIADDRILLLGVRGYRPCLLGQRHVELPFGPKAREPFPIWTPGGRTRIRRFDAFFDELCGGRRFHYYTVNSRSRYHRVIASSPHCAGFSYLEVGLSSYRTRAELEKLFPPRGADRFDRLVHGDRLGVKAQYADGYAKAYGLGRESFPGFERRVEVSNQLGARWDGVFDGVERVLVFDGMSAHGKASRSAVEFALGRLLDTLRDRGERAFHYKFHPAQMFSGEDRHFEAWLAERAADFTRTRLGPEVILEELAHRKPETHFYVGVSSLGIYAAQAGCTVESYAPWIAQAQPRFARHIRSLPEGFTRRVRFLS